MFMKEKECFHVPLSFHQEKNLSEFQCIHLHLPTRTLWYKTIQFTADKPEEELTEEESWIGWRHQLNVDLALFKLWS